MLKNKKCQALLIAASAFIGINGNASWEDIPYSMDDSAIISNRIVNIKNALEVICITKSKNLVMRIIAEQCPLEKLLKML